MRSNVRDFAVARTAAPAARGFRVLGVDPGLLRTGFAVLAARDRSEGPRVVEAGVIRVPAEGPLEGRLLELERCLSQVIESGRPDLIVCEQLYAHYRHPRTAILMGHARGVIFATAARLRVSIVSVAATNVKKYLTGAGHAGKAQVQRAVAATLGLAELPEPHDVADAMAIGLCGLGIREAAAVGGSQVRRRGRA